jgi:hypothetical protein
MFSRFLSIVVLAQANGCLLIAAGVVEANRTPIGRPVPSESAEPGEHVVGSDGTHGWRTSGALEDVASRLRDTCEVGYDEPSEIRASCNGTPVLARHDGASVFRLCPASVDHAACVSTWRSIH